MKRKTLKKLLICLLSFLPLFSIVFYTGTHAEAAETSWTEIDSAHTEAGKTKDVVSIEETAQAAGQTLISGLTPADGKKIKIACIGDSITYGYGAAAQATDSYPAQLQNMLGSNYQVGNFGRNSAYLLPSDNPYNVKDPALSYRKTQAYRNSLQFNADAVIIMLGINDIRSMSCEEAINDVKESLINLAQEYMALPTVKQVYIATSTKVVNSVVFEQLCDGVLQGIQFEVAEQLNLPVIDIWGMTRDYFDVMLHYTADKVHPNTAMYKTIAKAVYSVLMGTEYTPAIPATTTGVVYLSGAGISTGKGSTPETALNNLAKAVGLLREHGGTVVVCGPYSLTYEMHLPYTNGRIIITSVYDGVNYATSNGAKFGIAKNLYFNGNYTLKNLRLVSEVNNSIIACNYNDVTFDKGITCTLASGITSYPLIVAGYNVAIGGVPVEDISMYGSCNITVNSGSWAYIRCGNRRGAPSLPMGTIDKKAVLTVTVNGGIFANSTGNNFLAATGMNSVDGKCALTINGGTFNGNVYAVGRAGSNTSKTSANMNGTAKITITGGTFKGSIIAVQDSSTTIGKNAKYEIYLLPSMTHLTDKIHGFETIYVINN